jgi:urease accessory protein
MVARHGRSKSCVRTTRRWNGCFELGSRAKLVGWEIVCLGLPARKQPFDRGELRLHLELWVDDSPLLIDRLRISENAQWGLGGHEAIGTLLAYPATRAMVESVRELKLAGVELGVSLVDKVLVCRALAAQGEPIKRAFIETWKTLRPQLLDRPAVLPRIWAT